MPDFEFVYGQTALSTVWAPVICCSIYLSLIYLGKRYIAWRGKPYDLNAVVIIHNSLLCISSAVLLTLLVSELYRLSQVYGFVTVVVNNSSLDLSRGTIYFCYYVNYLFKLWEFIDTFLLVLRGKPTDFLHVYHHAATFTLCWSQLAGKTCIQWCIIGFNLLVHVIMYAYYALHALGIDVWWKRYLTQLQIAQFIFAAAICTIGTISATAYFLGSPLPFIPIFYVQWLWTAFFGTFILASYLLLFIDLYRDRYSKSAKKTAKTTVTTMSTTKRDNSKQQQQLIRASNSPSLSTSTTSSTTTTNNNTTATTAEYILFQRSSTSRKAL
eukprot:TRINITY_DN9171_c0_g1_i1.p1 TRINITY_DN9171_c0_g1~~TRINITY_DN9171_c0_g1_i1.p1  ORF type:complete len:326 (-),score=57.37 TRINITY_DN9171_c0_g1_i1:518-1495(-)